MDKYRKKPVVIDAYEWREVSAFDLDTDRDVDYYRTPDLDSQKECEHCGDIMHNHGWIDTLEGGHIVCPGDMVITGVKGEFYPCKPDIFALTYEEVSE